MKPTDERVWQSRSGKWHLYVEDPRVHWLRAYCGGTGRGIRSTHTTTDMPFPEEMCLRCRRELEKRWERREKEARDESE